MEEFVESSAQVSKMNKKVVCEHKKKLLVVLAAVLAVVAVVACLICVKAFDTNPIKSEAAMYVKELKNIDTVKEINAVVGIASIDSNTHETELGYVIFYSTKSRVEFAYFKDGKYYGNGRNNGGAGSSKESLNDLIALHEVITALEFIDLKNLSEVKCEQYYDVREGVAYINLIDINSWIKNKDN